VAKITNISEKLPASIFMVEVTEKHSKENITKKRKKQ
jgi:hypothetical protein